MRYEDEEIDHQTGQGHFERSGQEGKGIELYKADRI